MSSTFKRLLAMMFAFTLLAAACGSDSGGSDTEAGSEGATETTAADDSGEDSGSDAGASGEGDCASEEVLCVGLVTDVGKIDDKSFNQSAWEGVQASVADVYDFIETQDSKDYATNIGTFLDQDYDIIVTVGFALGEATTIAAGENPDTLFIGVDQFQGEPAANVAGLIFPEDKAGFIAGALAGLLTETNTVAAVLGTDLVPPVVAFKEGYEAGAKYTNPDVELLSTYHPGGLDVAFVDPAWGADTARQALDSGADVVFGAGGLTGNGALGEVAKDGGAAFCIGVDSDQWETVPEAHPCLVTSAMKLINPGVVALIAEAAAGSMTSGNFVGDVGIAPYHDFDSVVSPDVKAQVDEITVGVLDGSIPTGYGG
ncbi:MAG: BMP family ABC transporter substrate-binding protein [Acidimicrobiales bacterium]